MHSFRAAGPSRILHAVMMAAALMVAQWLGLQHRIEHASLERTYSQAAAAVETEPQQDADHSCAVFDAATVADTVHTPPYTAPLPTSAAVLARWAAFICWDAPPVIFFSSRAPPLA